jgi:hypothetical protein
MEITVRIKNEYGNERVYPVCDIARLLLSLSGRGTFSPTMIEVVKALGYSVNVEQKSI